MRNNISVILTRSSVQSYAEHVACIIVHEYLSQWLVGKIRKNISCHESQDIIKVLISKGISN